MAADMTGSDTASPSKPATINLQDEPVKIKETDASERDPRHLNDHVKVMCSCLCRKAMKYSALEVCSNKYVQPLIKPRNDVEP